MVQVYSMCGEGKRDEAISFGKKIPVPFNTQIRGKNITVALIIQDYISAVGKIILLQQF